MRGTKEVVTLLWPASYDITQVAVRSYVLLVVGTLVLLSARVLSDSTAPQSRIAGKRFIVARYTPTPPVIDGVFSLADWGLADPVYVAGSIPPCDSARSRPEHSQPPVSVSP